MIRNKFCYIIQTIFLVSILSLTPALSAHAEPDHAAEAEARKSLPVESNLWEDWPYGPEIGAQAAILMEAETGTILYAKNIHDRLYPASITKILTGLITMEQCTLDEMVTCSARAVNSIDWRSDSNIDLRAGEQISVEHALYGLLAGSANEVANALGEHISGSMEAFAELMNQRTRELGCVDSNWVTTNGIFDENHYTSVYDMALIAQEFFSHELLCRMSSTPTYVIPQSETLSRDLNVYCKNKLLEGKEYEYEYLVGSKTGYTSEARQNLVSCAEKDGMKLICVVMREEAPNQFTDTVSLFNYGFNNFKTVNVAEADTQYSVESNRFFETEHDLFGNYEPLLEIDPAGRIVIPNTVNYEDVESRLIYASSDTASALIPDDSGAESASAESNVLARLEFTYHGLVVGNASINLIPSNTTGLPNPDRDTVSDIDHLNIDTIDSSHSARGETIFSRFAPFHRGTTGQLFINVRNLAALILIAALLLYLLNNLIVLLLNFNFTVYRRDKRRRKRRKKSSAGEVNLDRYLKKEDDDLFFLPNTDIPTEMRIGKDN